MPAPRPGLTLLVFALALALFGPVPAIVQARDPGLALRASSPGRMVATRAVPSNVEQPLVRPDRTAQPAATTAATADIQVTYHGFSTAAQAAFEAAVSEWEQHIVSSQIIHVDATWEPLGYGVLGQAGPTVFYLMDDDYWYVAALAEARCGCEGPAGSVEIEASFNSAFGDWYLGTDGNVPSNKWDFYSVALHELGHGLGFLSTFWVSNSSGGWGINYDGQKYPTRFDAAEWTAATAGHQLTNTAFHANPSTGLVTQLTDGTVYFAGSNVAALLGGRAKLYAPSPWEPGSSNSHFDEDAYPEGTANGLLTPYLTNGEVQHEPGALTLAVFRDIGWQTNEGPPPTQVTVSVSDAAATEGENAAWVYFTLSEPVNKTVTVSFATQNGTAVAPADYLAVSNSIQFLPYETTKSFPISIVDDALDEPDESFTVDLSSPVNATIDDGHGVGTIIDNDGISITDVQQYEGAGSANLVVSLSGPMAVPVTVHYETVDMSATAPADYTAISGTLTFNPGTVSLPLSVQIVDDAVFEGDHGFGVELANATNATINKHWGGVTIIDNDEPESPSLFVIDSRADESGIALIRILLAPASDQPVQVSYATADGTAVADYDYVPNAGSLTFEPGQTIKGIYVELYDDSLDEANETFVVNLSNPSNAIILDAQGTAMINDDDAPPFLSIGDVSVNESAGNAVFTVTLSAASGRVVTVDSATTNGSATAPDDFSAWSGPLTFNAGQTSSSVSIPILDDTADEANEAFTMSLSSPANANLDDAYATGTIVDNDEPAPVAATISIADASVKEGNQVGYTVNLVFKVTLSRKVTGPVTVQFATANGTAVAGTDYIAKSGLLTWTKRQINRGKLTKSLIVKVKCDRLKEANETLLLILSGATKATIADGQATGTIVNDD